MLIKTSDLWTLDVINTIDGQRLGNITDLDIDLDTGKINALVLTETSGFMGIFRKGEVIIPWDRVLLIGIDVILVEIRDIREPRRYR